MNSEESRFGDLLNKLPCDNSHRNEHREQLRQQVLEAFDAGQADLRHRSVRNTFLNWREIMSRPAPRFAAAALVMATVCAVLGLMFHTQATVIFASLIEPILKARTARFNVVIEGNNLSKHISRTLYLEPNRFRQEMPDGQIHITDFTAGRMLILVPAQKSATLFNLTDTPTRQKPANFFDELRIRLRAADDGASSNREPLGRQEIAGRDAIGFRLKQPYAETTIWGDPQTGLPVLVEMTMAMLPDMKVTLTDFEFDVELDEALFTTEQPDGYSLQEFKMATPAETDLIAALKLLSDHNGGLFPDTFDHAAIVTLMASWVEEHPGEPNPAWSKDVMNLSLSLNSGLTFAATLPADSNARYAGKGIKYDDATMAVFWYKPPGAANYRVIYGDLSVKEQNAAPESLKGVPVSMGTPVGDWMREILKAPKVQPAAPPVPPAKPRVMTPPNKRSPH
jgi:outer membrane lipoprotein-sorting protein